MDDYFMLAYYSLRLIGWQLDTFNALDTKAIGLLGFNVGLGALMAQAHALMTGYRLAFFIGLFFSALAGLQALRIGRIYLGPDARRLYALNRQPAEEPITAQLVADLGRNYAINALPLAQKGWYCLLSAGLLVCSLVVAGIGSIV
ncbi:hypothetical protein TPY_0901 [Sulfobacillus acidophilus TPY]|uniref:Uncharacterized protein n=1 Tax=Sulfobacillus acidophilus (strain ATCC 700253 / DSM 10332 / NAL) TaxID=679936 RepID=G8TY01_SULAD|nr:hypothetical protein TPY_0901 [Sulfobacillus acidophilus TPY]AEW06207.1 hypothetical protein Sulac_2745 [Sulfobacillus acidophilus DSM 10332]